MIFKPREYQSNIIDKILSTTRTAIFAGMGLGKTSATLIAIDYLRRVEGIGKTLVIAPLRVAKFTWPEEIKKWSNIKLKVSCIIGDEKDRISAINDDADIYTVNYENIKWLIEYFDGEWAYDCIVADESTRLKSFRIGGKSVRARALSKVAWKSERFIELTGTPAPNGLLDLWGQFWFLDKGKRLGRSMTQYTTLYFSPVRVGKSPFAVSYEPREYAQNDIQNKIRDISVSIDAKDYFSIKDPIKINIEVIMPQKAIQVYKKLQEEMFYKLEDGTEINAISAASLTMKCLQASSGAIYDEDGKWHFLHDIKIDALKSIIEEANGSPVLVVYHWKSDADRILKAIPDAVMIDDNVETINRWNSGKIKVMLIHPASAGHGLNLQDGGNILIFFSHWWDLEQYQQVIERIGPTRQYQAGHYRPVWIYYIIAKGTLDEVVMKRREEKRSVQDLLLESLKYTE